MLGLSLRPARREAVVLLLCAVSLALQLLLPGFIGLADNGDFPKVSRPLSIGLADERAQTFDYFVSDYVRRSDLRWDSGLHLSAIVPAWIASRLQRVAGDPKTFDIRWLGGVNAALFLVFFYVLLMGIRPLEGWRWIAACVAALWIFLDVSYVAYFNSFFPDSAALLGAMAGAAGALWLLAADRVRLVPLLVFACGALLFVTSKTQHAFFGFMPAILLAALGWRAGKQRVIRSASWAAAACVLAGEVWMLAGVPYWHVGQSHFNVIFLKIAKESPQPLEDLRELGLGAEDLKYIGLHSFAPGNPTSDDQWLRAFCRRSGSGRLPAFYLRHPSVPLGMMRGALVAEAGIRRPAYSNFQREDGEPPRAQTGRFASWTRLRDALYRKWPTHAILWFAGLAAGAVLVLLRCKKRYQRALATAALGVGAIAVGEFCVSALADAVETHRHLLLFHLFTDFTIFFVLLWGLAEWQARRDSNPRPPA